MQALDIKLLQAIPVWLLLFVSFVKFPIAVHLFGIFADQSRLDKLSTVVMASGVFYLCTSMEIFILQVLICDWIQFSGCDVMKERQAGRQTHSPKESLPKLEEGDGE